MAEKVIHSSCIGALDVNHYFASLVTADTIEYRKDRIEDIHDMYSIDCSVANESRTDFIMAIPDSFLDDCLNWAYQLSDMGFFNAPASAKYHAAYAGGLYKHSKWVTAALLYLTEKLDLHWLRPESPWIIGMFHDLCKSDEYIQDHTSYSLIADGSPIYTPENLSYNRNDDTKLELTGHGNKSVMLASTILQLTPEEMLAIRYHMGAYEISDWAQIDNAINRFPNVYWAHVADMMASKLYGV